MSNKEFKIVTHNPFPMIKTFHKTTVTHIATGLSTTVPGKPNASELNGIFKNLWKRARNAG
jgi:hypothetical protein